MLDRNDIVDVEVEVAVGFEVEVEVDGAVDVVGVGAATCLDGVVHADGDCV